MRCANHPDRTALGYCSSCGKALCNACLVRTSAGNYCERCTTAGDRPARPRRMVPWWAIALGLLLLLVLVRAFVR